MIDRARFPSEIPQGHFIHHHGPARLAEWGLLDRIRASGCPPVASNRTYFGDFVLETRDLILDGIAWGYGPRRGVLDKILVDAAVGAGAELCEGVAVESLLMRDARVSGVRTAASKEITARLTIGADGRHSRVAQQVKPTEYETAPTLVCWYFTYFRDVPDGQFEMHVLPHRRVIFAHPTNDGLLAVFVGWPIDEFPVVRRDLESSFMATLDQAPGLGERIRAGHRVERFYGSADLPNYVRTPFGSGWALVGDAGCRKDPYQARGVCDALRDAQLLAEAAHNGLSGNQPMQAALACYQQRRDEEAIPDHRENLQWAQLGPVPPDILRLRHALRDKPADATHFFLARYGRLPRESFFNPSNLARILDSTAQPVVA
jgi:flavin-dependent dehydrogenase